MNRKPVSIAAELTGILFSPYHLAMSWLMFVRNGITDNGPTVSFTPLNSINDHTGVNTVGNWVRKYGYWGVNFENNGRPLHLSYPPLTYYLIAYLGLRKWFITGQILFAASAIIMMVSSYPALLLLMPLILTSPFYKNHALVCGRHDFIGFGLYLLMLFGFAQNMTYLVLILLLFISGIHPALAILGWMTVIVELAAGRIELLPLAGLMPFYICAMTLWLYPYLLSLRLTQYLKHSWKPPGYTDRTRSRAISLKKTIPYLAFALYSSLIFQELEYFLILMIPLLFEVNDFFRGSVMNRFSVDLLKVVTGLYVICAHPDYLSIGLYLLSIYYYSSPSSRDGFTLVPISMGEKDFAQFMNFFAPAAGNKVLVVSQTESGDQWRQEAKIADLCMMVNSYRMEPALIGWFHSDLHDSESVESLLAYAENTGVEYLIFTSQVPDQLEDAEVIDSLATPVLGDVASRCLTLARLSRSSGIVYPPTPLKMARNSIMLEVEVGVQYCIRLMGVRGWRGVIDGICVDLHGDKETITFVAPATGTMNMTFSYASYWRRV